MKTLSRSYKVFKPNKNGSGSVLQFNPDEGYNCIFLEIAAQNGDNSFDYEKKIVMKLGQTDLLSLLYMLELVETAEFKHSLVYDKEGWDKWMAAMTKEGNLVNLFHKDEAKGSTSTLTIKPNSSAYGGGFSWFVSKKHAEGPAISHRISTSPIETLGIVHCIRKCLSTK